MQSDKMTPSLDTETKIRLLLSLINDEGLNKLQGSMDKLVTRLLDNLSSHREAILKVIHLPLKTGIYANLLTCLYLQSSKSETIKNFIRDVFESFANFMNNEVADLMEDNSANPYILFRFVKFTFELYTNNLSTFESLKNFISILMTHSINFQSSLFRDLIIINLPCVYKKLKENNQTYLNKLIEDMKTNSSSFDNLLVDLELGSSNLFLLDLNKMETKEEDKLDLDYKVDIPQNYLFMCAQYFKYSDIKTPDNNFSKMQNTFLQIHIEEILNSFSDNIELTSQYLNNIVNFFGINDSVKAKEIPKVIISTIFNSMLKPYVLVPYRQTFYSSLLITLEKKSKNYSPLINDNIQDTLDNLQVLSFTSLDNFSKFLSFYLPNIDFDFDFLIFVSLYNSKNHSESGRNKIVYFLSNTIEKLCALATKPKLEELFKDDDSGILHKFIPSETPRWKFLPNEQYYFDTEIINDYIQTKKDYSSWTNKFNSSGNEFIYVFSSCLFYAKSKTFSHLRESLNFYSNDLKLLINSEIKQNSLINALFDVWGHSAVHIRFILELLLNKRLIDHQNLVKFIFNAFKTKQSTLVNNLYFSLIDISIINSKNLLNRLRTELKQNQEKLINIEETSSADVVKLIEDLENDIDSLSHWTEVKEIEILSNYFNLYLNLKDKDENYSSLIYERISEFCDNNKWGLIRNKNKLDNLKGKDEELNKIVNNIINY